MAAKKKYKINPETLAMEQVESGLGYWLRQTGIYILSGIVLGVVFLYLFLVFFPSPREKQLLREKEAMQSQMETLNRQVDQMQIVMTDLQQRDDNLYRVLFGAEPIPLSIRQGTQRKISYYEEIAQMTKVEYNKYTKRLKFITPLSIKYQVKNDKEEIKEEGEKKTAGGLRDRGFELNLTNYDSGDYKVSITCGSDPYEFILTL
jgi:hypothetical protein